MKASSQSTRTILSVSFKDASPIVTGQNSTHKNHSCEVRVAYTVGTQRERFLREECAVRAREREEATASPIMLTLGRTRKFIPPPWYKVGGAGMEPLPGVFDMFQYFETILPLVESL